MSYFVFFIAFAISSVTVPPILSLAKNNGAIALPGNRHIHTKPTPKFGGIAIALSVFIISAFLFKIDRVIASYLASSALMLLLGIIDDVKATNWKLKLLFSLSATSIFIFGCGIWIKSLGNLFGIGEIQLGLWGIPFTYFAVFGVINAINLIDGLDGLASGVSSIAFTSFAIFAYMNGNNTVFYLSLVNLGATLGLLRYNYPNARIFIGDSGSLFLGFSLAVMAILLTQGSNSIRPMVPVLILGIPIFDTLRVMVFRIMHRRNPFHGDKTHLHHLMHRSGTQTTHVAKRIWALSCVMSFLAFALYSFDSWLMLLIYADVAVLMGIFIENLGILKLARNTT